MLKIIFLVALLAALSTSAEVEIFTMDDMPLEEHSPVLVKFGTPWCGYCTKFIPTFKEVADQLEKYNVRTAEVNCDENRELCMNYDIGGYPTILLFTSDKKRHLFTRERQVEKIMEFVETKMHDAFFESSVEDVTQEDQEEYECINCDDEGPIIVKMDVPPEDPPLEEQEVPCVFKHIKCTDSGALVCNEHGEYKLDKNETFCNRITCDENGECQDVQTRKIEETVTMDSEDAQITMSSDEKEEHDFLHSIDSIYNSLYDQLDALYTKYFRHEDVHLDSHNEHHEEL